MNIINRIINRIISIPDPSPAWVESELDEFVLKIPDLKFYMKELNIFPCRKVFNNFMSLENLDKGMGGVYEWKTSKLTDSDYCQLLLKLESAFEVKLSNEQIHGADTFAQWRSKALTMYSKLNRSG
jgi:hypothetical protein